MKRTTALKRKTPLRAKGGRRYKSYTPNPAYQEFVRLHGCVVGWNGRTHWHSGSVEFDHIKSRGAGGCDEGNGWGLCALHHVERHTMGLKSFAAKYGVNPHDIGNELWAMLRENTGAQHLGSVEYDVARLAIRNGHEGRTGEMPATPRAISPDDAPVTP